MAKAQWRIYYGDESVFDNLKSKLANTLAWNVQAVIQLHIESGRYIVLDTE